jgi:hypothetical protein
MYPCALKIGTVNVFKAPGICITEDEDPAVDCGKAETTVLAAKIVARNQILLIDR